MCCVRAESDIDNFIVLDKELLVCDTWGGITPLEANMGRGMLNLCISDVSARMQSITIKQHN